LVQDIWVGRDSSDPGGLTPAASRLYFAASDDVFGRELWALDLTLRTLAVGRAGTGSGTVTSSPTGIDCGIDCTEDYYPGTLATLMPTPAVGSSFTGWSGDCVGSGACVVTMDADRSVTATFTLDPYTLTVSRSGSGGGTVTSSPPGIDCGTDCTESYPYGTEVVLTALAADGSTFSGWSGACGGKDACAVTMDAEKSVTARFTREDHGRTDFDGDGWGDLLWRHELTGELVVWLMNGTVQAGLGHLTPPAVADALWQIRGIADFDGNGTMDILWHHQGTGELYVWSMNGTVQTGGGYLTPRAVADTLWQIRGVADFDGNGTVDILWHDQISGGLYVWLMDGTAQTGVCRLTPHGAPVAGIPGFADTLPQVRGVADFDRNNRVDILLQRPGTGELYVWFLDGLSIVAENELTPRAVPDPRWQLMPR
jgi:hypothetical protein